MAPHVVTKGQGYILSIEYISVYVPFISLYDQSVSFVWLPICLLFKGLNGIYIHI